MEELKISFDSPFIHKHKNKLFLSPESKTKLQTKFKRQSLAATSSFLNKVQLSRSPLSNHYKSNIRSFIGQNLESRNDSKQKTSSKAIPTRDKQLLMGLTNIRFISPKIAKPGQHIHMTKSTQNTAGRKVGNRQAKNDKYLSFSQK